MLHPLADIVQDQEEAKERCHKAALLASPLAGAVT
jgi:hypothetical protein